MLFQGPSILKFSCAFGANNQSHQFRRLDTRFIIATSETILNIVKNFVRKYSKLFGNFSTAPPPIHQTFATALSKGVCHICTTIIYICLHKNTPHINTVVQ